MGAIIASLGLNWPGFLEHLVNFLVLLVLLRLALYKPVLRVLDQRATRVRESLAHADEARRAAEQAESDRQALLTETRREAEQIRARAEEQAKKIAADLQEKAQEDARRVLSQAQAEIAASQLKMMDEVRSNVADLVVTAVDRVTRGALDPQAQQRLVQQFLVESGNGSVAK